jgi:hypothetical protein
MSDDATDWPAEWPSDFSDLDTAARGFLHAVDEKQNVLGLNALVVDLEVDGEASEFASHREVIDRYGAVVLALSVKNAFLGILAIHKRHPELKERMHRMPEKVREVMAPALEKLGSDIEVHDTPPDPAREFTTTHDFLIDQQTVDDMVTVWCALSEWETITAIAWLDRNSEIPESITSIIGSPPDDEEKIDSYLSAAAMIQALAMGETEITSNRLYGVDTKTTHPYLFARLEAIAATGHVVLNIDPAREPPGLPDISI